MSKNKNFNRLVIFVIAIFICHRIFFAFYVVRGNSMEPALYNGDVIFVINHNSILYETINKNDVVLIEEILIRKKILIKRVNKIINKTKLENDSFTKNSQSKNLYYILGDNVSCSIDSRYFGPVPEENIIGKAVLVFLCYHNGKFRWDRFFKRIE